LPHPFNLSILKGPNHCLQSACATGASALVDGFNFIQQGDAHVMVIAAGEACINALAFTGFSRMKALATGWEDPVLASRPFDTLRNGFVLGEGAGAIILEDREHAQARSARIYAEILGYGISSRKLSSIIEN
jgi:3-oxoacyl-[acyl-carrier-protein] synthase II